VIRTNAIPPSVHAVLRSPGEPLAAAVRAQFEPRFRHDFGHVRIHRDARAAQSARAVGAQAYAAGADVVFATGRYRPDTADGRELLAHELAHVVQQPRRALRLGDPADPAERAAAAAAARVAAASDAGPLAPAPPALRRVPDPYITKVAVSLNDPESATLTWSGTPPASPGTDSFTVSTGKGYSDPDDEPGTCTRTCCSGATTQCAPPWDEPRRVGACCTPIGTFHTGTPRAQHNGWNHWTPVEPLHTTYGRGIALHQHTEVTGQAIGHGCIRMEEDNALRIRTYSRGRATSVVISGRATVLCGASQQCGTTGMLAPEGDTGTAVAGLTRPDAEEPGSAPAPAEPAPATATEAVA
jgi:hypothetical protein